MERYNKETILAAKKFVTLMEKDVKKIVIYLTDGIGDVILATAGLEYLTAKPEPVEIFWIGKNPSINLISKSFKNVTPIKLTSGSSIIQDIRILFQQIEKADHIIDMQRNGRSLLLCFILKLKLGSKTLTCKKESTRRSFVVLKARLRGRRYRSSESEKTPLVHRYKKMLALCTQAGQSSSNKHHSRPSINSVRPNKIFDISIGLGAKHAPKAIPVVLLTALMEKIQQHASRKIVFALLGDSHDEPTSLKLVESLGKNYQIENFVGKTSLIETKNILAASNVCLSADSAIGHLSEAVSCPVAVLFGPTSHLFGYQPVMPQSQFFRTDIGCSPCSKDGSKKCRYDDQACFSEIDLTKVTLFLNNHLQESAAELLHREENKSRPTPSKISEHLSHDF